MQYSRIHISIYQDKEQCKDEKSRNGRNSLEKRTKTLTHYFNNEIEHKICNFQVTLLAFFGQKIGNFLFMYNFIWAFLVVIVIVCLILLISFTQYILYWFCHAYQRQVYIPGIYSMQEYKHKCCNTSGCLVCFIKHFTYSTTWSMDKWMLMPDSIDLLFLRSFLDPF